MYPGVGPAAAGDVDPLSGGLLHRLLHDLLHRDKIRLTLQAMIGRAVVPQAQRKIPHSPNLRSTMTHASTAAQNRSVR